MTQVSGLTKVAQRQVAGLLSSAEVCARERWPVWITSLTNTLLNSRSQKVAKSQVL
jgi:hypothetical protein